VAGSVVLVTPRSFGREDLDLRAELEAAVGEVRYNERGRPLTAAELRAAVGDVDGLLAGLDEVDATVFAAAPRLRVVARYGVGTSNVDLRAAAARGVVVTSTPGANTEAVAELTIGFIFALARGLGCADRAVRAGCPGRLVHPCVPTLPAHRYDGGHLRLGQRTRPLHPVSPLKEE